jgi:hypothetical protein
MDFDACIKVHLNPSPGELSYVGGHGPKRVVVGMWASHPQRCASVVEPCELVPFRICRNFQELGCYPPMRRLSRDGR